MPRQGAEGGADNQDGIGRERALDQRRGGVERAEADEKEADAESERGPHQPAGDDAVFRRAPGQRPGGGADGETGEKPRPEAREFNKHAPTLTGWRRLSKT